MAQELLLAGTLTQDAFNTCITAWTAPSGQDSYMLLERQPREVITPDKRRDLLHFDFFNPRFDFTLYTSGRIFHEAGELRWERQQSDIYIVYTGDTQYQPSASLLQDMHTEPLDAYIKTGNGSASETEEVQTKKEIEPGFLLFGKRLNRRERDLIGPIVQTGNYYAEVRIPRLLHYPLTEKQSHTERVELLVHEYVHPTTGANVAFRFVGLHPYVPKKEL